MFTSIAITATVANYSIVTYNDMNMFQPYTLLYSANAPCQVPMKNPALQRKIAVHVHFR